MPVKAKKTAKVDFTPQTDLLEEDSQDLKTNLLMLLKKGRKNITLDFSLVKAIDSTGIGILIATQNSLMSKKGKLTIINVQEDILNLFKLMRLNTHFEVQGFGVNV